MKKFFALMLAAVMALSLVACGSSNDAKDDQSGDQPAEITSTLGILETAWNDYGDDEKFSVVGGETGENMVEDAPADYDLSDRATAEANLALPETAQVDQAATLSHALNPNTFTAAAYHATGDAKELASALRDSIQQHHWMCGFPEKVVVAVRGEYVVTVVGAEDLVDAFASRLNGIFGMELAYDEAMQA